LLLRLGWKSRRRLWRLLLLTVSRQGQRDDRRQSQRNSHHANAPAISKTIGCFRRPPNPVSHSKDQAKYHPAARSGHRPQQCFSSIGTGAKPALRKDLLPARSNRGTPASVDLARGRCRDDRQGIPVCRVGFEVLMYKIRPVLTYAPVSGPTSPLTTFDECTRGAACP
jgi:hypothetical protein